MDNAAFPGVVVGHSVPFICQLGSAAVSSCGNGRTACAALDDTDGDMTEIYGEHLLSVRGIAGSVEPDKRKAGVRRLRRAHKGFGERTVAMKSNMLVVLLQIGLCVGIQPLVGYNYGARNKKRLMSVFKFTGPFSYTSEISL